MDGKETDPQEGGSGSQRRTVWGPERLTESNKIRLCRFISSDLSKSQFSSLRNKVRAPDAV